MIRSKRFFISAIVLLSICLFLSFSYPTGKPLGEQIAEALGLSVWTNSENQSGFNLHSFLLLGIFLAGIICLFHSLQKYQLRSVFLTILIIFTIPPMLLKGYQYTFASGVYAITYGKEYSRCEYQLDEDNSLLHGECFIPLRNYSNDHIQLSIEFLDWRYHGARGDSLMNAGGPFKIIVGPNESKIYHIKADIDVSKMNSNVYPYSGVSYYVDLRLSDGNKIIELSQ
ncbi:hypothetical protein [Pseudalkalibacillus berkeleyi]|uniref:Uncharacterized protein n=1 Tax=Pseudalkalibacillus berkeleyi TaxID=1069813 RepID=A0ABS9GU22_9BACL|nr:hypothetical protein [Pseudalkalibacillus berkeleyi]MCF6136337.1 hypothetical protein [Pseudalkalibacillus berkeleyi]